jgi:Flp pilus assembly protein CpaB
MEAVQKKNGRGSAGAFLATRRGAVTMAVLAAVLAGLILLVFLTQYRSSVQTGNQPTTVLVADRLIPKGTSGDVLITEQLFKPGSVAESDVKDGALANAAALEGQVAARDIYPGQQIIAADFTRGGDSIRGKLSATDRAMAVSVDEAHGLIGNVRAGDRVDVLAGFNATSSGTGQTKPIVRTLLQNVLVLGAPEETGGSGQGDKSSVLLRVNDRQAAEVAYASDNGQVWVVLRPPAGASQTKPSTVSLESLIAGGSKIAVDDGAAR